MIIKIQNLRILPWNQKDQLKAVFGDTLLLTFEIPHVDGESYACGLDNERFVYPPSRPLCAYTNTFIREGNSVTFSLKLNTSRFRDFVNGIRKPMPVWIQVVRTVLGKCETIVLDDILALPSVIDGANTVCEGDPLAELLDAKMDKPYVEGIEGQVLMMGADGHYAWSDMPEIPEQEQANWDESDSTAYSYIKNKPIVYTQSETNALLNDKANKATTLAGYGITDAYTKTEVDAKVASVYRYKGTVQSYSNLPSTGQEVGDVYNIETADAEHGIKAGDNVAWNGTAWDALAGEIVFPEQVQANWDESDSSEKSFIQNKPVLEDTNDYLCFTSNYAGTTVALNKIGNPEAIDLEYSTDKKNWTAYTWSDTAGAVITLANIGDKVWFRGNNDHFSVNPNNRYTFVTKTTGNYIAFEYFVTLTGNVMSLLDKTCKSTTIPTNYCFNNLFNNTNLGRESKPVLPATTLTQFCYYSMFIGYNYFAEIPVLPASADALRNSCYSGMFAGTYLNNVVDTRKVFPHIRTLPSTLTVQNAFAQMFLSNANCVHHVVLHITNSANENNFTNFVVNPNQNYYGILEGAASWNSMASSRCAFVFRNTTTADNAVPSTLKYQTTLTNSGGQITVMPSAMNCFYFAAGDNVTLNAIEEPTQFTGYAEMTIDVGGEATLTAGTNMTFVDTPEAGKRNVCVIRWSDGAAKLYVTMVEDMPA